MYAPTTDYKLKKIHGHRVTGTNTGVGATPCIHQTPFPLLPHRDAGNDQLLIKDGTEQVDRQTNQQMDEQNSTNGQGELV
ncbi:unnamed protein product [Acanthocheilonema viteae]|uniref:Uncharacterized protein n=1 Tax=Acanthocheilonema viteae TaxID=6277 RepID=A0A498S9P0_ACAVI|nr:unnamed protein product [Acanthocheilonema viteae]